MKTETNIRIELGRRIRERRKKLGMTQSQLCGDYMTRNMLSRIETGDANPSLDTLIFISKKLKTPPAFFLCQDAKEEAEYTKTLRIKDARRALGTGQYKKCIDLCSELPSDDDEVSFILSSAELMIAVADFDRGDLTQSLSHLDRANTALHQTIYMYSEMQSQIKLLRLLISALCTGILPEPSALPRMTPVAFSKDRFLYITLLCQSEHSLEADTYNQGLITDQCYGSHLEARALMAKGRYNEAFALLRQVLDKCTDSFTKYFALCDIEKASDALENFRDAYNYAKERMALHEAYTA